jgi:exodeoxyribonuclease V gamma subunit
VDASPLIELASFVPSSKISPQMLQRFLANPVQYFFNERLKVYFDQNELEVFEDEPFALDGLQRFSLQHELLTAGQHADSQANLTEVLQLHSEKLQRSGALPMCAFGEQARAELVEPLLSQLEDYRKFCQVWPHEEDNPRIIEASVGLVQLEGWLSGLRRPAVEESQDSEYARIELLPGKINVGKDKRWHRLLRPWVEHVLSNATGISMQTIVIAQESSIAFASLATLEAQQIVEVWLAAWQQGIDAPLPVALKTAMNFLKTQSDDKAKAIYEGGYNISGEVQNNAALARQFPTFADLKADGQFSYWAEALYGALANASITTLDREGEPS